MLKDYKDLKKLSDNDLMLYWKYKKKNYEHAKEAYLSEKGLQIKYMRLIALEYEYISVVAEERSLIFEYDASPLLSLYKFVLDKKGGVRKSDINIDSRMEELEETEKFTDCVPKEKSELYEEENTREYALGLLKKLVEYSERNIGN